MSLEAVLADPAVPRRGLTRAQYDALIDAGALDGVEVELVEGVLVDVVPQGDDHADVIAELTHALARRFPEPWRVRVQLPLAATDSSEPEPDLAIAQRLGHGKPRTAALVIEVTVTTHRLDLVHKPVVYAAAGVEQYWVLDLPAREVVVHLEPGPSGYAEVQRLPWGAPLSVLGVPVDLAALLPPR